MGAEGSEGKGGIGGDVVEWDWGTTASIAGALRAPQISSQPESIQQE